MPEIFTAQVNQELFEGHSVPNAAFDITQYEANEDYFYAAYRLLSWFPVINVWGKTYFSEDINDDVMATVTGAEVDLLHDQSRIVGVIQAAAKTSDGLDVLMRFKRSALAAHDVSVEDIRDSFNKCSLELTKNPNDCDFLVLSDNLTIERTIPMLSGLSVGMRPTSSNDDSPFYFQSKRVVERVRPTRFTGVGILNNPADKTAVNYGIVASDGSVKPLDPIAPASESVGEPHNKDAHMDPKEVETLKAELEAVKAQLVTFTSEQASETQRLATVANSLNEKIAELTTELAASKKMNDALMLEKMKKVKEEKASALFQQFSDILAPITEADKALYREKASSATDNDGVIREFTLDLREKKLDVAEAASAAAATAAATSVGIKTPEESKVKDDKTLEKEEASGTPIISFVPKYDSTAKGKNALSEDEFRLLS